MCRDRRGIGFRLHPLQRNALLERACTLFFPLLEICLAFSFCVLAAWVVSCEIGGVADVGVVRSLVRLSRQVKPGSRVAGAEHSALMPCWVSCPLRSAVRCLAIVCSGECAGGVGRPSAGLRCCWYPDSSSSESQL